MIQKVVCRFIGSKAVSGASGIFHVVGNFASAAEAIEAGNYPLKWGYAVKPDEIPLIIQPVDSMIRLVPLGRQTRAADIYSRFTRMVDPITAFSFGVQFQQEQERVPIIMLWKNVKDELWYVCLDVCGRQRCVDLCHVNPGVEFGGLCRVLVREVFSPSA